MSAREMTGMSFSTTERIVMTVSRIICMGMFYRSLPGAEHFSADGPPLSYYYIHGISQCKYLSETGSARVVPGSFVVPDREPDFNAAVTWYQIQGRAQVLSKRASGGLTFASVNRRLFIPLLHQL